MFSHLQEVSARDDLEMVAAQMHTLSSLKSSFYRIRWKWLPPFPKSRGEVHFEGEWAETHSGGQLLMEKTAKDQTSWLSSQSPVTFKVLQKLTKFLWMELFRCVPDCSIRYSQYTLSKMESNSLLPTVLYLKNPVLFTCELLSLSNKKLKTLGLTWVHLKS